MTLKEAIEHLDDVLQNKEWKCEECKNEHIQLRDWLNELKACKDLEEKGRLLKLPCAVGDTVYTACSWGIETGTVGSIEIISDRIFVNNLNGQMIGEARNIFVTREEAEAALKI